jgi:hypothetical protein
VLKSMIMSESVLLLHYNCNVFFFTFLGNTPLDAHDGSATASWVWTSCQPVVGGIQDALEGISASFHVYLLERLHGIDLIILLNPISTLFSHVTTQLFVII